MNTHFKSGALILLLASTSSLACAAPQTPVQPNASLMAQSVRVNTLAFTEWELTAPVYPDLKKPPFLKFGDGRLGASVGLNSIGGAFKAENGTIVIGPLLSTKMAGPPALMTAENQYSKALEGARSYQISGDGQTLTLRGAQELTFRLTGLTKDGFQPTETKIINVAPQLGPAMDGDKTPKYLQLEDLGQVGWGHFTEAKIEGFDYQPGNRYQLRVQVERNARTGEKRLRLLEVLEQEYMNTPKLGTDEKILEIAPTKVDCVGEGPMKCLQVREVGGQWKMFYSPIEGFDFVEGYRYRVQIKVSKIDNPPADSSSLRYELVRVLDKRQSLTVSRASMS